MQEAQVTWTAYLTITAITNPVSSASSVFPASFTCAMSTYDMRFHTDPSLISVSSIVGAECRLSIVGEVCMLSIVGAVCMSSIGITGRSGSTPHERGERRVRARVCASHGLMAGIPSRFKFCRGQDCGPRATLVREPARVYAGRWGSH